jgi:hypothetical protein
MHPPVNGPRKASMTNCRLPLRLSRYVRAAGAMFSVAGAVTPAAAADRFVGEAYASGTTQLLYRELHWRWTSAGVGRQLVLYECADGTLFARKALREVPSAEAPDFDFEDARDGYREGVETAAGRRVHVQESERAAVRQAVLPQLPEAVIDAGFDPFLRAHWAQLLNGGRLTVPFLVPSRLGFMDFSLARTQEPVSDSGTVHLQLRLAAWYAAVLPSLRLTYDRQGTRLLEFEGPGTIRDARGRNRAVRIVFPDAEVRRDVPRSEVEQASVRPLSPRCAF